MEKRATPSSNGVASLIVHDPDDGAAVYAFQIYTDWGEAAQASDRKAAEKATKERAQRRRINKVQKAAKKNGWRVCPDCDGVGCKNCAKTGVDLASVAIPKISEVDAAELASFRPRSMQEVWLYGNLKDPTYVRNRAAEIIVWVELRETPPWFWHWTPVKSTYLCRLWRPLMAIEIESRGWPKEFEGPLRLDILLISAPEDGGFKRSVAESVAKDPAYADLVLSGRTRSRSHVAQYVWDLRHGGTLQKAINGPGQPQ
jgi:hypothetical protein